MTDPRKPVVAFDVDGTLIHQVGPLCDTPRYEIIALFHIFERLGCNMVIWSGSGMDHAERWAEKLGLNARIIAKGSIVADIAVDDLPSDDEWNNKLTLGKVVIKV